MVNVLSIFLKSFTILWLVGGCGTWVGTSTESDKGKPEETKVGDTGTDPVSDKDPVLGKDPLSVGDFKTSDIVSTMGANICQFDITYLTSEIDPDKLSLSYNADGLSVSELKFSVQLPGGTTVETELVDLKDNGFYKFTISYQRDGQQEACKLNLEYLKAGSGNAYQLEFIIE